MSSISFNLRVVSDRTDVPLLRGAMLKLDNGLMQAQVNENLGGELFSISANHVNYLASYEWISPIRFSESRTYGSPIIDWLSEYRGGWQVLFPNAGNEATVKNVPLPFHGEFARTKVEIVHHSNLELTVRAGVRLPLILTRTYRLIANSTVLQIEQEVTNESEFEMPFIWGEHPAFSLPSGSKIKMPIGPLTVDLNEAGTLQDIIVGTKSTWPMLKGKAGTEVDLSVVPDHAVERLCYLHDRPEGWVAMTYGDQLLGLSWDIEAFPHMWMWQEIGGPGFPWFGRSNITALEPASTWPSHGLDVAIKAGQAFTVKPGEKKTAWTTFSLSSLPSSSIDKVTDIDSTGIFTTTN
jgi:galactose mutarotase-like enzyme